MGQHSSNQDKPSDSEIDQLVMNEYLYPIAVNYQRILEVNNWPAHTDGVLYVFSVPRLSGWLDRSHPSD